MHVVFRESHGLEETDTPFDVGQDPAELIVLSFSDSDLGAFAAGWHRAGGKLPSCRLANLVALKHPLSVDTYAEQTLEGAKGVLVRLIGGESYWSYGLSTLQDLARRKGIALAVLPADGREDPRLDELSTLPVSTLRRLQALCDAGGAVAAQAALAQLALAAGLYAGPVPGMKTTPDYGYYDPDRGVIADIPQEDKPLVLVSFYRSYLTSADTAPVDALIAELRARGYAAYGAFAASLKATAGADWLGAELPRLAPAAIINATAFSAQGSDGRPSPLSVTGCPVFQVALSTARRKDWAEAARGLSPADLAMHVVLPEVDGRIMAGVVSFKAPSKKDPDLQYSRFAHRADPGRVRAAVDRIEGWLRLAQLRNSDKRLALVLSTYPGRDYNIAHAVGLDALASCEQLLGALADQGYSVTGTGDLGARLGEERIALPLADYKAALKTLPAPLQTDLQAAWGAPEDDPDLQDGAFHMKALTAGKAIIALQPERGEVTTRVDDYHDLDRTPRHAYVAFYLWLQQQVDAVLHIGAHGTLEWLPGKAVALSDTCWPEALTSHLPVIYPFIVNDPGEAAQAKRRIGGVTIGHLPPPLAQTTLPEGMARLESLLDEYSTADGLDPARRDRLIEDIRAEAQGTGVEADLGLTPVCSAAEAITRIDAFVCDIKESQYGEGLHIFGTGQCGPQEITGVMDALSGRLVAPGPSGSPFRGRTDVIPTGRNLFTTDPRAVPSRAAHAQGVKLAEELLRRHLQDHGDWPRGLVIDLWGSATMRTAGEEFAMALHLAGLAPKWDEGSERVSGFEVLPLSMLNRPRIDVTLRVSGLFRDVFPSLAQMFETAAAALANRDEAKADNPYLAEAPRVFGPKPGQYGLSMGAHLDDFSDEARAAAGEAWLNASSHAIDAKGEIAEARTALEDRLKGADSFVHLQDLPETDLLVASDYAAHEAGFAAAMARIGQKAPVLYHLDATRPDTPQARSLSEEIARVTRARAANPDWATSMMRHGFRGGAEIAATLDHMAAFAHLAQAVPPHLFDLYFEATLGRDDLVEFLERENPDALAALRDRFRALAEADLWVTRRNSIIAELEGAP
ncbi:cobaltochelatase subunit CobN [Phaeobacter gallaeciensis]|uniref:cobaltochelatase subunit CobN n=1 Tax=Phaeobacter gallaeciensis TaxID=60890 RepID=UPI00237F1558|nr:cobaltochelatase subunit CobN [Phaeobacter gallaeciensis]MDE4097260.1 cobaltochelatase subunit CobN [Phaeobacter gallaeciensis]MDE4106226.1 cobaltochelatase subunit CobN [Phaeobacter gallaeciensis]MDE4110524.1 cobaltochelatase subunit CobN [Phaeobacter gallaeciensis]MDE4114995.1 cobaltochelatase subunit CobN [Phaeobacter gallaeciensis]MDE4119464.1 cobaltochelatase subunit CobN [Phaeobacter gallaeciensis]